MKLTLKIGDKVQIISKEAVIGTVSFNPVTNTGFSKFIPTWCFTNTMLHKYCGRRAFIREIQPYQTENGSFFIYYLRDENGEWDNSWVEECFEPISIIAANINRELVW